MQFPIGASILFQYYPNFVPCIWDSFPEFALLSELSSKSASGSEFRPAKVRHFSDRCKKFVFLILHFLARGRIQAILSTTIPVSANKISAPQSLLQEAIVPSQTEIVDLCFA